MSMCQRQNPRVNVRAVLSIFVKNIIRNILAPIALSYFVSAMKGLS